MPSSHLFLWYPLLLLPSIFPSIRDFFNESVVCIRRPKYWSFSFSVSLSNVYSGLISLKIDWFDLLAVQGTLRSLLQFKVINSLVLCLLYSPALTTIRDHWEDQCCCSVAQSCLPLCDPVDCSTPGLPVHTQLPGLTQTNVHGVSDALQPSPPLLSPSPPTFNLS